jgi:hypothetical protein
MASATNTPPASVTAPPGGPPKFFSYALNPPQLTANQVGAQAVVQLDKDFDFLLDRYVATSTGLFSVYLQDSSRGIPLMSSLNTPINGENIAGNGNGPYWLAKKMRIPKGTVLAATFNDRSGALNTIQFVLVGKKVPDKVTG